MRVAIVLAAAVLKTAALAPPSAQAADPQRLYANFPLLIDPAPPNDRSPFQFSAHHIRDDSNAVALHMEFFGVPWREFGAGINPPEAWLRQMDAVRGLEERLGLPVYLALTPIDGSRDRLASNPAGIYALTQDDSFGARCEPIDTRPDYETVVRPGFERYVSYMIQRFQPRFVALSVEVNIYKTFCPAAWIAMQQLLNETYDRVKLEHPGLPVFHTFQTEFLWLSESSSSPCFGFHRECLVYNIQELAGLRSDLYALSSYPAATFLNAGRQLPDDYLTAIASLSGKPIAISETAYPAVTYITPSGGTCVPIQPSSVIDQAWWMARMLRDAARVQMPFVVWWANEDLLPGSVVASCNCPDNSIWCNFLNLLDDAGRNTLRGDGGMGLRTYDGDARPAHDLWRHAVEQR
jgi:hypothetical protein